MKDYEKRQYQEEAVGKCIGAFADRSIKSVMLESPVGSGKTYMALETIHRLQERLGRELKVNWVAPRKVLLQQVMEENRDLYQDNIRPVSLFEHNPPSADLVVLDEAHHEATQSCVLLYEKMHHTWTLGLSATPMRTDRMKLSFQDAVRTCPIGRLIREGHLSPFNSYLLPKYSVKTVAECYLSDPNRWGKSLVFFHTIAECVEFRELMRIGGVDCEVVTADSDKDYQLERFAQGKTRIVANVAMLSEGFDQPDVQTVFARDASRLPTIQMCGRGLRTAPGKEFCNIVQSSNTNYLFEKVAPPKNAFRFQEGRWLALKDGTKEIEETLQETLRLIAERNRRDRQERPAEYRQARRRSESRFERELDKVEEADKRKHSYYASCGGLYKKLYGLYKLINVTCWGGQLPKCVIHLSKKEGKGVVRLVPDFMQEEDGTERPALVFNVANCTSKNSRQIALIMLFQMLHLHQVENGREPAKDQYYYSELLNLGCHASENAYDRGSAVHEIFRAVDADYLDLNHGFCCARNHAYGLTRKGDREYFLSQQ